MIWLLYAVGALVALIVIVLVVGMMLPQSHSAARRARLAQPPGEIFTAISDYRSFTTWRSGLKEVRPRQGTDGRVSWVEVSRQGELPLEIVEAEPPRRLVGRIADPKLPFGGTWTYQVEPTSDGGSELTITEDGEVYNPVFRFMARFVFGYTATLEQYLRDLGRKFGQEVEVTAPTPAMSGMSDTSGPRPTAAPAAPRS